MNRVASEKQQSTTRLLKFRRAVAYRLTQPAVRLLARTSITPNALTWIGFFIAVGAAALIITGHLFAAGFVVLFTGFFDSLDGALARHTNRTTRFGAALDSILDRVSEAVLLIGILVVYAVEQSFGPTLLVSVALLGSLLVSYVRARAEALDVECEVGFFTRTERVIVLGLGLLLSPIDYALITALAIIAVFSFITVGQRVHHIWRQTKIK